MLRHIFTAPTNPIRVVMLGARGFIGRALMPRLNEHKIPVLALGSDALDLTAPEAEDRLAGLLTADDVILMLSAITPDKGRDAVALIKNLAMAKAVCGAMAKVPVAHVVYVSSDAVYPFNRALVNEESPAAPIDLYGSMHRTREIMFEVTKAPVAVLRPTLIYGAGDTHNSYGPNRFRRQFAKDGKVTLGGNGEETRDHIFVGDVADLVVRVLRHRSAGRLNLATGRSVSFLDLAKLVAERAGKPVEIATTPRSGGITHRAFDVTSCRKVFPEFVFTSLEKGLSEAQRDIA